jgi:phosphinothricin acetyltransferase
MLTCMRIRSGDEHDLEAVAAIYDREVAVGVATFDLEPRPVTTWRERLSAGDPLFVAVDGDGTVVGYASASAYRPKEGYRFTREATVYVAPAAQGQGVGSALYAALLRRLREDDVHLVLAAVALPNAASLALHSACGFRQVGVMREVGHKHGRWIDVMWLQRRLG